MSQERKYTKYSINLSAFNCVIDCFLNTMGQSSGHQQNVKITHYQCPEPIEGCSMPVGRLLIGGDSTENQRRKRIGKVLV